MRIFWTLSPSDSNREIDVTIEISSGASIDTVDIHSTIDDMEVFGWRMTNWLSSSDQRRQLEAPLGNFDPRYAGGGFSLCASKVDDGICEVVIRYFSGDEKFSLRTLAPRAVPLTKLNEFVSELNEAVGLPKKTALTLF